MGIILLRHFMERKMAISSEPILVNSQQIICLLKIDSDCGRPPRGDLQVRVCPGEIPTVCLKPVKKSHYIYVDHRTAGSCGMQPTFPEWRWLLLSDPHTAPFWPFQRLGYSKAQNFLDQWKAPKRGLIGIRSPRSLSWVSNLLKKKSRHMNQSSTWNEPNRLGKQYFPVIVSAWSSSMPLHLAPLFSMVSILQ